MITIAVGLRIANLKEVPPPFADEVYAAVDFHYLIRTGHHFDGSHAGILAHIIPALDGRLAVALFGGTTVQDFRLFSAFCGVVTVGLVIWLGRLLGDPRLGVLAGAALAVMPWHIYLSRVFIPASEYVALSVLAICLELVALQHRSVVPAILSALAAVGTLYLYPIAIVSTPALIGTVLAFRWREVRAFSGSRILLVAGVSAIVLLIPYLLDHIFVSDPGVANANSVIGSKLLSSHNLSVPAAVGLVVSNWLSYFSPNYVVFHGDPNPRQSIQVMGEIGWSLGLIGAFGIVLAMYRRTRADLLLLVLTAVFPLADALTFYDAPANSVRGAFGSVLWALWAGSAALGVMRALRNQLVLNTGAIVVSAALFIQLVLFAGYYFGPYATQYSFAFETGYAKIYQDLRSRELQDVPITLHAGYQRDAMLQYFSDYRLHAPDTALSCNELPFNIVHYTVLPRLFVIREDHDFAATPGCIDQSTLISRDISDLSAVTPQPGEGVRRLDMIDQFPNDPQRDYYTAILYLHH